MVNPYYYQQNISGNKQQPEKIALVCNNASLTDNGTPVRLAMMDNGYQLVKLFSPEHGLTATGVDGAFQQDGMDELTGLPITSLYGHHLAPTKEDLQDIDLVLFDIPDVGCRFYTYLWTMTYVMEACARYNIPLIIADRPNPIGGNLLQAEGPMLEEATCASFIGRWSIPVRHCCTLGELALYFAATKLSGLKLKVIPVSNWHRSNSADDPFTPTSPAIQHRRTALLYPGMGLMEGIHINEGRGTETPFEICGAPWMNAHQLQQAFIKTHQPGLKSSPISYTPVSGLYAGELCHGLHFTVTDEAVFRPVKTGIALIQTILQQYPARAAERLYCTVANPSGKGHLDKLLGVPDAFLKIKNGEAIPTNRATDWAITMQHYLLYAY